jgi:organic radical activating enzyme
MIPSMLSPRCNSEAADLAEVFSAIQGEGVLVGIRQIFIRFLECHIACNYCDTPDQNPARVVPQIEQTAGLRDWEAVVNPVPLERILGAIRRLNKDAGLHRWVSLTGGEPLWYWPMIEALAGPLKADGLRLYLETNGLLAEELRRVVDRIDMVAMDIKLHPTRHGFLDRDATLAFFEVARRRDLLIKVVIPSRLQLDNFLDVVETIAPLAGGAPLVLQPVSPYGVVTEAPSAAQMLAIQGMVNPLYPGSRVVPQVHKLIGQH